jgi:hypothetical protein
MYAMKNAQKNTQAILGVFFWQAIILEGQDYI